MACPLDSQKKYSNKCYTATSCPTVNELGMVYNAADPVNTSNSCPVTECNEMGNYTGNCTNVLKAFDEVNISSITIPKSVNFTSYKSSGGLWDYDMCTDTPTTGTEQCLESDGSWGSCINENPIPIDNGNGTRTYTFINKHDPTAFKFVPADGYACKTPSEDSDFYPRY